VINVLTAFCGILSILVIIFHYIGNIKIKNR
jgi:hypothetical protein